MKIAYYAQHVLGLGHFHRSLQVCRAFAEAHETWMIVGGPELPREETGVRFQQLAPLRMNQRFEALEPVESGRSLAEVQEERRRQLLACIDSLKPDALILELFPFGRKKFRFELEPLLALTRNTTPRCRIYSSLRDILVEKTSGREAFERRAVETLNRYFDGVLIHADPRVVTLEQTFELVQEISIPIHYTGYISPRPAPEARSRIRLESGIEAGGRLIVGSIGGGAVGAELLLAAAEAGSTLDPCRYRLQCFTGPYSDPGLLKRLNRFHQPQLRAARFTSSFIDWLAAADLSISMAGYNTCLNVISAGVPALMFPFAQNREQRLRLSRLAAHHPIRLLEPGDLEPRKLARLLEVWADRERTAPNIDLDGAAVTVGIVEKEHKR